MLMPVIFSFDSHSRLIDNYCFPHRNGHERDGRRTERQTACGDAFGSDFRDITHESQWLTIQLDFR